MDFHHLKNCVWKEIIHKHYTNEKRDNCTYMQLLKYKGLEADPGAGKECQGGRGR